MIASFIIGFHTARFENLLQTLRLLISNHSEIVVESELITLCQDSCAPLRLDLLGFDYLTQQFKKHQHFDLNLKCMHLPKVTNLGVDKSTTDRLVILESDRILPQGYFAKVLDQLKPGLMISTKKILKLTQPTSDKTIQEQQFLYREDIRSTTNEIGRRNMWSGNTAVWKNDFYTAGKMDEFYLGYGWADSDMTNAMNKVGISPLFRDEIELHLWHPPATYGEGDQKKMFIDNGVYFCKKWNQPYPNFLKQDIATHSKILL